MAFRIGRKYASHTYPTTPRAATPALLQVGSDLVTADFAGLAPFDNDKVERSAGVLLQVPLEDFRRDNGLWIQASMNVNRADTGDVLLAYTPWVKFSTLPEYFAMVGVGASLDFREVGDPAEQAFFGITLTLDMLVKLPAASSDDPVIAIPTVDDILVGIVCTSNVDFVVNSTSIVIAGEIHRAVITQSPTIGLVTLP